MTPIVGLGFGCFDTRLSAISRVLTQVLEVSLLVNSVFDLVSHLSYAEASCTNLSQPLGCPSFAGGIAGDDRFKQNNIVPEEVSHIANSDTLSALRAMAGLLNEMYDFYLGPFIFS